MLLMPGVNFINVIFTNFSYERRFFYVHVTRENKTFVQKICTYNVDEIDYRCQFQQHFTRAFFNWKCFGHTAFLYLHFGFVIFWRKNIGAKAARKMMLMKLTIVQHVGMEPFK